VAKKEHLFELLKEKRTALITQAVTKGLDSNVPMKDSGVEWLGEIPACWEVGELRRLNRKGTSITYGIVQAGPHVENGVPYIRTSDMAGEVLPRTGYQRASREVDAAYQRSKIATGDVCETTALRSA
jgi:type I restriction enzyme, S subunit